ncbi:Guanine nucleotide-binding protein alpha-2 subunit [Mucor velutinosus]|uniref:Guanine nucleotide-binding protein alpha-2 subunit n=1 Tax=Mucor velutinosus TaxID=708070 RepID=A0AAN7D6T4_9FUNG|nr:Guanine nucleotide-binding protein alpha-2 subunit [Mucor velutinosus]
MRLSCSICLEKVTEDSELVSLTVCGHVFDAECKCPLCNRTTSSSRPAYKRVYFSAFDGDDEGKDALMAAKEELKVAKDALDTLNEDYDGLALKWTVAIDESNAINREKTQLEKDIALKDVQINKLTHNWQASKARNKDDIDKMNLELIAKQKSINSLIKNLDKSNRRIKLLKEELDALKPHGIQDNVAPPKSRYRDQNFKAKYHDLNKEHKALKDKMGQLEKKFIDLTLAPPEPPSSILPSNTKALQSRIQLLEKQLQAEMTTGDKLLKKVIQFKQLNQDAVKEKEELQVKLADAKATIASLEHGIEKVGK